MNAIYSCCISQVWLETSRLLKEKLNIECKYFIGWKDDLDKASLRALEQNCHIQFVEDAWRGVGFPTYVRADKFALDESSFDRYAFDIWIATKMIDRQDPTGELFSFSERNYWIMSLIEYWIQIIDKENIELVISPSIPHRVFDYALYIAAKIRNVKFLMFQMTPFGDRSFIIDDVNSTPRYMKDGRLHSSDSNGCLPKDIAERLEVLLGSYKEALPDYMIKQNQDGSMQSRIKSIIEKMRKIYRVFKKANTYRILKKDNPKSGYISLGMYNLVLFAGGIYKKKLKNQYHDLVNTFDYRKSSDDKYVLVALHYQPEETSCPTGGMYTEQRQIVKILANVLPSDYKIYVKEHSTQFLPKAEGEAGRTLSYYRELIDISERVVLISEKEDTFKLIDAALATVTISGTVGWESVFRGTPAIIFGRAWYEDMPGVFKVKDKKTLKHVIHAVLNENLMPSKHELLSYHTALNKYLISASHYKTTANKNITGIKESALNLSQAVDNYFKSEAMQGNNSYHNRV